MLEEKEKKLREVFTIADKLQWEIGEQFHDRVIEEVYAHAKEIAESSVIKSPDHKYSFETRVDKIITSKIFGFPLMLLLLALVFWITIVGANYPSKLLSYILVDKGLSGLKYLGEMLKMPSWFSGFLFDGMYLAGAWVVSVMLPPMAIFFPIFTLLEDLGYLPRVAFNLDGIFRKVGAHGRQALTMTMGFGCNAAGVVATRIIDSPRERLIAILTNNFSLCNGRWPTQILIATIFIGALVPQHLSGIVSTIAVVTVAMLGVVFMFLTSYGLTRTLLKGEPSAFSLELPPYRPPNILQTLYRSIIDRTIVVLWRAIVFAFPAGGVIWLVSNIKISGMSIAEYLIRILDPIGIIIGLNGVILLAYIIAIPANEIVIPTVLMLTVLVNKVGVISATAGVLMEVESTNEIAQILKMGGWTLLTGINLMLFSLLHNPCSTTIYTIYKETQSLKWTVVATVLPIIFGVIVCFIVARIYYLVL